jgi:hypothetical protein
MAATELEPLRGRGRELAHRTGSDIEVSLYWHADNSLTLLLVEVPTGVAFEFGIEPQDALEAFNHPYAFLPTVAVDPRLDAPTITIADLDRAA